MVMGIQERRWTKDLGDTDVDLLHRRQFFVAVAVGSSPGRSTRTHAAIPSHMRNRKRVVTLNLASLCHNNHPVYDAFLAPLEEGIYVRAGKTFHFAPCFSISLTLNLAANNPEGKFCDSLSRMLRASSDACPPDVIQGDEVMRP